MSPQTLFHVLVKPLQSVLLGKCFTAVLSTSTRAPAHQPGEWHNAGCDSNSNSKYIATKFKLLGPVHQTVSLLLTKQLAMASPVHSQWCSPGKTACEEAELRPSVRISGSTELSSCSIMSLASSPDTQKSVQILLEEPGKDILSSATKYTCTAVLPPHAEMHRLSVELSGNTSSHPSSTSYLSKSVEYDNMMEDSLCEGVWGELPSTWRKEETRGATNNPHNLCSFDEDCLPDSESFLEEFLCDLEMPSLAYNQSTALPSSAEKPTTLYQCYRTERGSGRCSYGRLSLPRSHQRQHLPKLLSPVSVTLSERALPSNSIPQIFANVCITPAEQAIPAKISPQSISNVCITPSGQAIFTISSNPLPQIVSPTCLTLSDPSVFVSDFTPELFSDSPSAVIPVDHTSSCAGADEDLSPELFPSPSSIAHTACTPAVALHVKSVPKRRLLTGPQGNCHYQHTPISQCIPTTVQSFSPELFP